MQVCFSAWSCPETCLKSGSEGWPINIYNEKTIQIWLFQESDQSEEFLITQFLCWDTNQHVSGRQCRHWQTRQHHCTRIKKMIGDSRKFFDEWSVFDWVCHSHSLFVVWAEYKKTNAFQPLLTYWLTEFCCGSTFILVSGTLIESRFSQHIGW